MSKRFWAGSAALIMMIALAGCTQAGTPPRSTSTANRTAAASTSAPPSAAPVVDHGPETGAEGSVIDDAAGVPATYVVVSGDNLSSIADRLGITVDELLTTSGAYGELLPGKKLALEP